MIKELIQNLKTYNRVKKLNSPELRGHTLNHESARFELRFVHDKESIPVFHNVGTHVLTLDEEDIEYFKNKYLAKAEEELQREIEELKHSYKLDNELD